MQMVDRSSVLVARSGVWYALAPPFEPPNRLGHAGFSVTHSDSRRI
jgi:hypothetical protein